MVVGVESNCEQHQVSADCRLQLGMTWKVRLRMFQASGGRNASQFTLQEKQREDATRAATQHCSRTSRCTSWY